MALSCITYQIEGYIGQNHDFFIPALHSTPLLEGSLSEYCHPVWCEKTRTVGLPDGIKTVRICTLLYNHLDLIPVCDRRTDRHLAMAVRDMHMRRAVKSGGQIPC